MEPDRIAAPLDDDRLRIVEQPLPRRSTEPRRAAAQRAGEGLGPEIEDELTPHPSRPGQDDHEEPQIPPATVDVDAADVSPVDLGLLSDEGTQAEKRLTPRGWSHRRDVLTQRAQTAGVPARPCHVVHAGRAEQRELLEHLVNEGLEAGDDTRLSRHHAPR